jgi:pimeloyl-ACP methyl ester carboxylesterase
VAPYPGTGCDHPHRADHVMASERRARPVLVLIAVLVVERESGPLFAHVDALSSVRDMDVLRVVLGEERLNYAGYSYGTVLGTWYVDLFPRCVGRMVLDSAADPTLDYRRWMAGSATAKEDVLNGYLAACDARDGCPFREMSADEARTWLLDLLRRTDSEPLKGPGDESVTQGMLYDIVYGGLMQPRGWPRLDQVMAGLLVGDVTAALEDAEGTAADPAIAITNAAPLCLDLPDDRTAREVMADAARSERRNPVFARPTIAGVNTVCAQWPADAVVHLHPVVAPAACPILVVGITHDTAGPYSWSRSLAAQLARGQLLTYDGYGHGAILVSACARTHENSYLIDGVLPAPGTVCCT